MNIDKKQNITDKVININIFPNIDDYSNNVLLNNYLLKISSSNTNSVVEHIDDFIKIFDTTIFPKKIINKKNNYSHYSQNLNLINNCNNCGAHYYEYVYMSCDKLNIINTEHFNGLKSNNIKPTRTKDKSFDHTINFIDIMDSKKNDLNECKFIYKIEDILKNDNSKLKYLNSSNYNHNIKVDDNNESGNNESGKNENGDKESNNNESNNNESNNNESDDNESDDNESIDEKNITSLSNLNKISKSKFELNEYNKSINKNCNCSKQDKKCVVNIIKDIKYKYFNQINLSSDNDNKLILQFYKNNNCIYEIKTNCNSNDNKLNNVIDLTNKKKLYKLSYFYSNTEDIYMIISDILI
jgi:SWI/SNF-related matrix-associated actin-dependent regulator of chromatin subfamily A protein 2/4